jgi:hypothetical protein
MLGFLLGMMLGSTNSNSKSERLLQEKVELEEKRKEKIEEERKRRLLEGKVNLFLCNKIKKCPICKAEELSLNGRASLNSVHLNKTLNYSKHFPVFQIYCLNCSHTMLFLAEVLESIIEREDTRQELLKDLKASNKE